MFSGIINKEIVKRGFGSLADSTLQCEIACTFAFMTLYLQVGLIDKLHIDTVI